MSSAIAKFALFTIAVLAFVGVRFAGEEWFLFPSSLAIATGFLVMGLIIKPVMAPDLPMSRWVIVPLAGAAIGLVLLTAPRWYERWAETLPDYLPTEDQFVALVHYYAQWSRYGEEPVDCGSYVPQSPDDPGLRCAERAIEEGRDFYFFYSRSAGEGGFARQALVSSGAGIIRLDYFMDTRKVPPFSAITQIPCTDPRFVQDSSYLRLQCGPWPTRNEFWADNNVGTHCGHHNPISPTSAPANQRSIDCVRTALENREAFNFHFDTHWGPDLGDVDGVLFWRPDQDPTPILAYYLRDDQSHDAEPQLIQRTCETPTIRLVSPPTAETGRPGGSSVEVDCGSASPR